MLIIITTIVALIPHILITCGLLPVLADGLIWPHIILIQGVRPWVKSNDVALHLYIEREFSPLLQIAFSSKGFCRSVMHSYQSDELYDELKAEFPH